MGLTPIEIEHLRIDFETKYPDGDFEHLIDRNLSYWENREILKLDVDFDDNPEDRNNELEQFSDKLLQKTNGLETTVKRLKKEKSKLLSEIEQKKIKEIMEEEIDKDEKELKEVSEMTEEEELKEFSSGVIKDNIDTVETSDDWFQNSVRVAEFNQREERKREAKLIVDGIKKRLFQNNKHESKKKHMDEISTNLKREYGVDDVNDIFKTKTNASDFLYLGIFIIFILGIVYIFL